MGQKVKISVENPGFAENPGNFIQNATKNADTKISGRLLWEDYPGIYNVDLVKQETTFEHITLSQDVVRRMQ